MSQTVWNKLHRYRCLVTKYWWVLLLTLSVALCLTAYFQMNKPTTFASSAKMSLNLENRPVVAGDSGAAQAQDPEAVLGGIVQIMQVSAEVHQNAGDILQAKYPSLPPRLWTCLSPRRTRS